MIRVLGTKRIFFLFILFLINAVFGTLIYLYLKPTELAKERELRSVRGDLSAVRNNIADLQVEFDQLDRQRDDFKLLSEDGFLSLHGRAATTEVLNTIQKKSRVVRATVNIRRGEVEDNADAAKASRSLFMRPITIEIDAIEDQDIYRYLDFLKEEMPGHIHVRDIIIRRNLEPGQKVLRAITAGQNPALVSATLVAEWRTLLRDEDLERILN